MSIYIERAKGSWLYGKDGEGYLDACAGTFNIILGHGNEEILAVVRAQMEKLAHYSSSWESEETKALCDELISMAPGSIDSCFCKVTGGSTANEVAIRMMARKTGKRKVIMMEGGHHGNTLFLANDKSAIHSKNKIYIKMPKFVNSEDTAEVSKIWEKYANKAEEFIKKNRYEAACMLIEPIQGRGGNLVPTKEFLQTIFEASRNYNVPIIADEVQTGIGRTGKFFACEVFGLEPDAIVLAKGLTGCGFPLGAVLYNSDYGKLQSSTDGFTFGSNPLSVAAARKTIHIVNNKIFLEKVRQKGEYLKDKLKDLKNHSDSIIDIRGIGLFMGITLRVKNKEDMTEILNKLLEQRVVIRTGGNLLKIRPPLTISRNEINFLIHALGGVLNEC